MFKTWPQSGANRWWEPCGEGQENAGKDHLGRGLCLSVCSLTGDMSSSTPPCMPATALSHPPGAENNGPLSHRLTAKVVGGRLFP